MRPLHEAIRWHQNQHSATLYPPLVAQEAWPKGSEVHAVHHAEDGTWTGSLTVAHLAPTVLTATATTLLRLLERLQEQYQSVATVSSPEAGARCRK